ncbi:MAG: hypothetical protein U5L10_01365 [Candidatus Moranbacteria bacterium]|nr:hypothetical protein [Candidatus Moranbacteria bacterium]
MRRHIKKTTEKARNVKYRITIFTVFLVLIYGIGFWYFNYTGARVSVMEGLDTANQDKIELEENIREMVEGYPIEKMVPYIIEKDKMVAAFVVSIAKKESNWGKRVPVLNGEDCFNYWGYRGGGERVAPGGYTCFDTRQEAVEAIAGRISELVNKYELKSPEDMIIWKCGSTCAGHSSYGVRKWISDVAYYFGKLY